MIITLIFFNPHYYILFLISSALCSDKEISGFDTLTGRTWIYPTNYPIRDYQFNIIKATILKNTLVSQLIYLCSSVHIVREIRLRPP